MDKRDKISVIVPCYNEEKSIPAFWKVTSAVLNSMHQVDYEIIYIDDGSTDGTLELLRNLCRHEDHCRYVSFSRNFGKEAAMYAGFRESEGEYCVIMDADLQHPPALLPEMYRVVTEEGYDCCGGKRCGRTGDGMLRSIFSRVFYKIGKQLTHMEMSDGYGDFRMMNRMMVNAILEMKEYNRYMKGIYSFVGFRTKWIEFQNVERTAGCSKWNFKSLLSYAAEGILAFSAAPLKIAGIAGGFLILCGVGFFLVKLLLSPGFSGRISSLDIILMVLFFISGLQMLFLYIIGAYISKDCLENKKRPIYIIKERNRKQT